MQVAFVFLESNGLRVTASQEEACLTFLSLAAGEITEAELAFWFAEHSSHIRERRPPAASRPLFHRALQQFPGIRAYPV